MRNGWRAVAAVCAVALWLAAGTARAQGSATGYGFGTIGQFKIEDFSVTTFQAGGGGEYLIRGIVGIGAEASYLAPTEDWGDGIGVFSVNGSYHFGRTGKVIPYVTAGYSLLFDDDETMNAFNVGGGLNYWFARRAGLRLEVRDHIRAESGSTGHFWGFRFGVSFR